MKLLVVGASGFIGAQLMRSAASAGHEVRGTYSQSPARGLAHFDLRQDRMLECAAADFFAGERPHVVICSAISQIDRCCRQPDECRQVNVDGTIRLIDDVASVARGVVFLSSSHVFDGKAGGYREEQAVRPLSEYGRQKVIVEEFLLGNVSHALVLRLDKIIGDRPGGAHLFSQWWNSIQAGEPIRCIENQVFSPTLVSDVAEAVLNGCSRQLRGLYHVSAPEHFQRAELAQCFVLAAGVDADVVSAPLSSFHFADARPLRTFLDGSRFIQITRQRFTTVQKAMQRFLSRT